MLLLSLILSTVLGVVTNSGQPAVRGSPRVRPFLPGTRVRDYYTGNVFQAFRDAGQYENALVMFYAAWDRESQQARGLLAQAAQFFSQTDILVAAVNCWQPTSDCAKEFSSKTSGNKFPAFMFYPASSSGLQYRGPLQADQLIRWVQHARSRSALLKRSRTDFVCRYAVTPLQDLDHLARLQAAHPVGLLVGYTPFTRPATLDPNWEGLLGTALLLLEAVPDRGLAVAVTADHGLARQLHLHLHHPVRLLTPGQPPLVFPNKTVEAGRLAGWALQNRHPAPAPWLRLPGRKSHTLSRTLGPHSLLVFTQHSALRPSSVERVVDRVAAQYRDCEPSPAHKLVSSRSPVQSSQACLVPLNCNIRSFSEESDPGPACRPSLHHNLTAGSRGPSPARWTDPMMELLATEWRAEVAGLAGWRAGDPGPALLEEEAGAAVAGLGCNTNRSLSILLVDTGPGGLSSLADSLGVRLVAGQPSLALMSTVEESVMQVAVSPANLSQAVEAALLTWHGAGGDHGQPGLRSSQRTAGYLELGSAGCGAADSCLAQITRDSWPVEVAARPGPLVVFFTRPDCSQCSVSSHVLHTVAALLRPVPNLQFRMVDCSRNDLVWQFTALAFPSVVFFPASGAGNTRVFPADLQLNSTNLLSFVLSNLPARARLRLALASCGPVCLARVRAAATARLARLKAAVVRGREAGGARRGRIAQHIRYVKTVLYVSAALAEAEPSQLPQASY